MSTWQLGRVLGFLGALLLGAVPATSKAQMINITIVPPELPVYEQPAIPASGYIWSPGYWAYSSEGYFWVPGTWVLPPSVGLLWTPGYWGWRDGFYVWNAGYWGEHIGFYGGVNYGYGYGGIGYEGGYWNHGVFAYNRTVNNFGGVTITNVYNKTVVVNSNVTRVSFNGGNGGITAQPTPQQQAAMHEQHVAATAAQTQHQQMASSNPSLLASNNHGQPAIAATAKPAEFSGKGVVAARSAPPTSPSASTASTGARPAAVAPAANDHGVAKPAVNETPPARNQAKLSSAPAEKPVASEPKPRAAPNVQTAKPPSAPRVAAAPRTQPRPAPNRGPPPKKPQ